MLDVRMSDSGARCSRGAQQMTATKHNLRFVALPKGSIRPSLWRLEDCPEQASSSLASDGVDAAAGDQRYYYFYYTIIISIISLYDQ